jgi:2-polyprenyl-3-methyl-5-hydroxy-6-metoxy-1,4-benzoquinol methylase
MSHSTLSNDLDFVLPDRELIESVSGETSSYAIRNYYGNGPIAFAKRQRFRRALQLAKNVPAQNVIDMGTGDGVLLPTLSRHYRKVVGVDVNRHHIEQASRLAECLKLKNVELVCLDEISLNDLPRKIGADFQLMLLLETLEHVGRQPDMWDSKMEFLRGCFDLMRPGGRIVATVPKMVGLIMLFKNLLQRALGRGYDPMSAKQLIRSSFLKDTDELEPLWTGGHVGFNHLKLDQHLENNFVIHHRSESLISVFYVLGRRSGSVS